MRIVFIIFLAILCFCLLYLLNYHEKHKIDSIGIAYLAAMFIYQFNIMLNQLKKLYRKW